MIDQDLVLYASDIGLTLIVWTTHLYFPALSSGNRRKRIITSLIVPLFAAKKVKRSTLTITLSLRRRALASLLRHGPRWLQPTRTMTVAVPLQQMCFESKRCLAVYFSFSFAAASYRIFCYLGCFGVTFFSFLFPDCLD